MQDIFEIISDFWFLPEPDLRLETLEKSGSMDDLFYPNNHKREARMNQLANDIQNLVYELAKDADNIKSLFEEVDKTIKKMYSDIEVDIPSSSITKFDHKGWVVEMTNMLEPLAIFPVATWGLQRCATSWLLMEGRIGEAALGELIEGLGMLDIAVGVGAIVIVVGVELGIDAIAGAKKRSKLRHVIHSAIKPRIELKKAAIINGKIHDKLKSVVDSCQTLKGLGYTQEQLDQAQKKIADEFKGEVSEITDETAKNELADLDKNRGSWTKEDH